MQTYTAFFNDWCLCIEMKRHRKQVPEKSHKRESCLGGYFLVIYLIVYLCSGLFCPGAFCTIRKVLVCSHTGFILNSGPSVTRRPFMLLSNSMLSPSFPFPMWLACLHRSLAPALSLFPGVLFCWEKKYLEANFPKSLHRTAPLPVSAEFSAFHLVPQADAPSHVEIPLVPLRLCSWTTCGHSFPKSLFSHLLFVFSYIIPSVCNHTGLSCLKGKILSWHHIFRQLLPDLSSLHKIFPRKLLWGVSAVAPWMKNLPAAAWVMAETWVWSPDRCSRLKDLLWHWSQLQLRLNLWPGKFYTLRVQP